MSVISESNSVWCVWLGVAVCKKVYECGIRSWGSVSNGLWQFWVLNTVFSLSKSDVLGCEIFMAGQTFTVDGVLLTSDTAVDCRSVISHISGAKPQHTANRSWFPAQMDWTFFCEFLTVFTINCIFALALFSLDGWMENLPMETLQSAAVEVEDFVLSAKLVSRPPFCLGVRIIFSL